MNQYNTHFGPTNNGPDPAKRALLDAVNNMGIKWLLGDALVNMSWLEMAQDLINVLTIVSQFEKAANPAIDHKIRDVLECDSLQHNELLINEFNRLQPSYGVFTTTWLNCGCMVGTGHIISTITMCDDHHDFYREPADSATVWNAAYEHSHSHAKNACMFKYPLELSVNDDGSFLVTTEDYINAFEVALANKKANLDIEKLDWSD